MNGRVAFASSRIKYIATWRGKAIFRERSLLMIWSRLIPNALATALTTRLGSTDPHFGRKSVNARDAISMVRGLPLKSEYASTRVRAPSNSRMLTWIWRAIDSKIPSGTSRPARSALERKIAIRVSNSGGWISAINPHSKRERKRSSNVTNDLGGRSEEMTICLFCPCNVLKVWKNSSCVDSFPAMNWMSSIRRTSVFR